MSKLYFKSKPADEEEVGYFPVGGKGVGGQWKVLGIRFPYLPDLLINLFDSLAIVAFALMIRGILPSNILFIIIPLALSELGDIMLISITRSDGSLEKSDSDYIPFWENFDCIVHFPILVALLCKVYLITRYTIALRDALDVSRSLTTLTQSKILLDDRIRVPQAFFLIDAVSCFLLIFLGNWHRFFEVHNDKDTPQVTFFTRWFSSIDTSVWFLYMLICRCFQPSYEIDHFSLLLGNLPYLYIGLVLFRCCIAFYYHRRNTPIYTSYYPVANLSSARSLFLLLLFISSLCFLALFTSNRLMLFWCVIGMALIERLVYTIFNVHLIYDARRAKKQHRSFYYQTLLKPKTCHLDG